MSPTPHQRKFTLNLLTEWRKLELPFLRARIVIAVSGGADSCALALGISELVNRKKLENRFAIAHFNHGLRGEESDADAEFVRELSRGLGFDYLEDRPKKGLHRSQGNLEQHARVERYRFLESAAAEYGASAVLTAHTVNDQAETLLMNLVRGSGLTGLSGMRPVRPFGYGEEGGKIAGGLVIARPLLRWAAREETVRYVNESGVEIRRDTMNDDLSFLRVRVRKELIPALKELNPGIVRTLSRVSGVLAAELEMLETGHISSVLREICVDEKIKISQIKSFTPIARETLVRKWLEARRGSLRGIGRANLKAVADLATTRKSGATVEIPGFGIVVKHRGCLVFKDLQVEK